MPLSIKIVLIGNKNNPEQNRAKTKMKGTKKVSNQCQVVTLNGEDKFYSKSFVENVAVKSALCAFMHMQSHPSASGRDICDYTKKNCHFTIQAVIEELEI